MDRTFGDRDRPESSSTAAHPPSDAPVADTVEGAAVEDAAEEWGMEGSGADPDIDPELAEAEEERAAEERAATERAAAAHDSTSEAPIGRNRRGRRTAVAFASVAVITAVALGVGVVIGRMSADDSSSSVTEGQRQVVDILGAPDSTLAVGELDDNRGTIAVVTSRSANQAVVLLRDLKNPLPAGHEFQLWLIGKSGSETPVPANLIAASEAPAPTVVGGLDAATTLTITVEPAGGSAQPTTAVLARIGL